GEVLLIRNLPFARPLPTRPQPSIRRLPSTARSLLEKAKRPVRQTHRAFCSGDVLLSHDLSSHYHRGCSVSFPCSEWELVVQLRYYHQRKSANPFAVFLWRCLRFEVRGLILLIKHQTSHLKHSKNCWFSDVYIQVGFQLQGFVFLI